MVCGGKSGLDSIHAFRMGEGRGDSGTGEAGEEEGPGRGIHPPDAPNKEFIQGGGKSGTVIEALIKVLDMIISKGNALPIDLASQGGRKACQ